MKEFKASRWTSGNMFFPERIIVEEKCIRFRKPGFFGSGKEEIMAYEKITSVLTDIPIIGFSKIKFDCGYDQRLCSGYYKAEVIEMKKMVHEISEGVKNKVAGNANITRGQSSVADEILKLKQLLDSGALSQEEFNQQKNKLINK